MDVQLSPEQRKKLSDASAIEPGFPHSFLQSDMMHQFLFGGTYDAIQKPAERR